MNKASDHEMFEKLSYNLNLLMAEARISASQLARNTGLPATTIKRMRNNSSANPTLTSLLPIAKFFGISVSQLIGDEKLPDSRLKGAFIGNKELWPKVPILNWEQAVAWKERIDLPELQYTSTDKQVGPKAYALIVGEENWENLAIGTVLIIDPSIEPEHRDYAIVYKEGQKEATLKQVLYDEGEIYLKPIISGYQITRFTDKHKFLGVVIEYKMELKP